MVTSTIGRIGLVAGVLLCAGLASAQPAPTGMRGARVYEEQLRVALDRQEVRTSGLDFGGWFSFAIIDYKDYVYMRERDLRLWELRGWASLDLDQGVHQAYVRGLLQYQDWDTGNNPIGHRGDDFSELVERAWYQFDLGRLMQRNGAFPPWLGFKVKAGREFMTIGSALTLSTPLDMVRFDLTVREWDFMAFLGQTLRDSYNVDTSELVAHEQERCFWGFELGYRGFAGHRPFVYFLANNDKTSPKYIDPNQKYDYSSKYIGLGSEGYLFVPNLTYTVELVGEWGRTYSDGVYYGQDEICAWALDTQLTYLFDVATHPRITGEYIYASGDSDRASTTSGTVGGNLAGTRDTAFNAFGYRDTGIALAPRVSNLQMYMIGASFFPLENSGQLFKKMEVGTRMFFYGKATSSGPITDSLGNNDASYVGYEIDAFVNWRLTSDLAWTTRLGFFFPGDAYDGGNKNCRHFLYSGLVFSF